MIAHLFFLWALLASMAHGAVNRSVTFTINETAPSASIPINQPVVVDQLYGADDDAPDVTVASTWSYLTCQNKDGSPLVEFSATRGTWPGSWPSTATCTFYAGTSHTPVNITINIVSTSTPRYEFDRTAEPNCSTSGWTLSVAGLLQRDCQAPAPPTGYSYALPLNAFTEGVTTWWPAKYQVGGSAAPSTDPDFPDVLCTLIGYGATPTWHMFVRVGQPNDGDITVYCPVRLYSTSNSTYSWWTSVYPITVDRP